jgi:hypothetical protein
MGAAKNCAYASDQLARIERLRQIVVRADFQSYNAVNIFTARGQQQHWNFRFVPQAAQNFKPVESRQHDIEDHQEELPIKGLLETPVSIGGRLDLEAFRSQVFADQAAKLHVVIDNKYAIHRRYCTSTTPAEISR